MKTKADTFALISGFLILFSIFIPIAISSARLGGASVSLYYWMFGLILITATSGGSSIGIFYFIVDYMGIVFSLIIVISAINIILKAYRVKTGELDIREGRKVWLFYGILVVILVLIWLISQIIVIMFFSAVSLLILPSFGFFGIMCGATFAFFGVSMAKKQEK